jgi:hypothetical protein
MSNITIDISKLTPAQAFELGRIMQDVTAKTVQEIEREQPKVITRTPRGKGKTSKRFKFNTRAETHVIAEAVAKRRSGMKLEEVADHMTRQGELGPTGKPFNSQSIWDVIYSKQAWKFWQA